MQPFSFPFKAMGSPCLIRISAPDHSVAAHAATQAIKEIGRLEQKYSRYLKDSYLATLNATVGKENAIQVDEETQAILNYAQTAWQQSDGLFDITSGILRQVWDFKSGVVPASADVQKLLQHIGFDKVYWQAPSFALASAEMELDLGGCVKEYAADAAAKILAANGVRSALVELGGDIVVLGEAQQAGWPIAIRDPRGEGVVKKLQLQSGAMASSGDYERCMMIEGKRYSHLLDPKSGWPVQAPASVTVIADNCLVAGTVSTVAMLSGDEHCLAWLEDVGLPFLCVKNDGQVIDCLT